MLTKSTSALSPRYKTSIPSRRSNAGISGFTTPLGKRINEGASEISTASRNVSLTRSPSLGAATCKVGTIPVNARSHMPLCDGPSSPVTPARSSTKVTPAL